MGNQKNKTRNISNALFTNTQQQVLRLLFGQTDKSFYSKELVDKAGIGTGTVHRELGKLSGAGLLTVKNIGNQKHYQANPDSPIYEELKGIIRKTFGISELFKEVLTPHQNSIRLAFIYGSVAKGSDSTTSDIDLMLISDKITYPDLLVSFADLENELGKKISPTIYSVEEFRNKRDSKNSFVTRVINQPKIILIGSENDIETM